MSDYEYGHIRYIKNCGPFEDAPENNENLDMILIGGWAAVVPEDLMTRAEWEASIDYEAGFSAAIDRLQHLAPTVLHMAWRNAVHIIVDAALNIEEDE